MSEFKARYTAGYLPLRKQSRLNKCHPCLQEAAYGFNIWKSSGHWTINFIIKQQLYHSTETQEDTKTTSESLINAKTNRS